MFGIDLGAIAAKAVGAATGQFFESAEKIFDSWIKGEISDDQKEMKLAELRSATTTTFHKQATALMSTMVQSADPFVRWAVPSAFWATLFIQVWYSWVQPFGVAMLGADVFPVLRPGDTVEWNFVVLLGLLGLHPSGLIGQVKGMFGRK